MAQIFRQTMAVLPVFLIKLMTGIGVGWLAPMLNQLKNSPHNAFTSEQCGWIAALHYLTRGISPFISIFMIDRLGRNSVFVSSSILCFIPWIPVYASKVPYVHYGARLLQGVGIGLLETTIGIYICENCASELRGVFTGITFAFFYLGLVLEFSLAAYLSYEWVAIWNGIIGFLVVLSTLLLREPAHFLLLKGEIAKAEKNYDHLHDLKNEKKRLEFEEVKLYVESQKARRFSSQIYRQKEARKSLRITLLTSAMTMGCGFSAVNAFVTMALAGMKSETTNQLTILFGFFQLLSVSLSTFVMDTFDRRTLFLLSGVIITVVHAMTALLCFVDARIHTIPYFSWLLFALLTSFSCVSCMFLYPVGTAIQGELLPQNVKAVGSSLGVVANSMSGFTAAKIFLPVSDTLGIHTNFILFSLVSLVMTLYVCYDLPETKGKTLVDIQRELRGVDGKKLAALESESENCL